MDLGKDTGTTRRNERGETEMRNYQIEVIFLIAMVIVGGSLFIICDQQQKIDRLTMENWQLKEQIDYNFEHTRTVGFAIDKFCSCNQTMMKELGLMK